MALDIAKLAKRLEELNTKSSGGGANFIDIKDGRNVVRILPPAEGKEDFAQEVFVHYGVGKTETNKKGTMVVCPTTWGDNKRCPVCDASKEFKGLSKKKDDAMDKQSNQLYRKKRVYMNAIDRSVDIAALAKDAEGNYLDAEGKVFEPVQILGVGTTIYKAIIGIICDPEYGDITDAVAGLDVIITKAGTGMNTDYEVKTVRKESPIGFDQWQEGLKDLSTFAVCKTYKELLGILNGDEPDEDARPGTPAADNKDAHEDPKVGTSTEGGGSNDSGGEGEGEDEADVIKREIAEALARRKNK